MKLYRPVLIESAEQAEALPEDAIVIGVETGERYTKTYEGEWWGVTEMGTRLEADLHAGDTVQALVPIEAEEEWKTLHEGAWHLKADEDDARNDATAYGTRRRYTTDWEETP